MTRLAVGAIARTLIGRRLRDVSLAGGLLDPFAGAPRVLLAHSDRQVRVTEQTGGLLAEARPNTGDFLEAQHEADVQAAAHRQHAVETAGRVVGQLIEDNRE